jgi:predicted transposase/invertase (TIGR01784 family)
LIKIKIKVNGKEKNIRLLNEYLFSKIFGEKGCERETLYLINTITGNNFTNVTYKPTEMTGRYKDNKKSTVDVLVMMNDGTFINMEAQIAKQEKFHKRSYFYNSKIYSIFLEKGDDYEDLPMTIMINLLNFDLFPHEKRFHHAFVPCDKFDSQFQLDDVFESHFIELSKFRREIRKGKIDWNDPKVRLFLLLDEKTPEYLIKKVIKMDKNVNRIYEKALLALQDQKEYLSYIRAEQAELDYKAQIKYAKKTGEKTGIKKGEKQGIKKGKEIGKKDGKIEIAIKLKKSGFPINKIAKITELSVEKIKKL